MSKIKINTLFFTLYNLQLTGARVKQGVAAEASFSCCANEEG